MNPWPLQMLDERVDLTEVHVIATLACAVLVLWMMLCTTRGATLRSGIGLIYSLRRLALGALSVALFAAAFTPLIHDDPPWAADTLVRVALLFSLLTRAIEIKRFPGRWRAFIRG